MKCTQCGSAKLIRKSVPLDVVGDARLEYSKTLSLYVCVKCGHFEWFDKSVVDDYNAKVLCLETSSIELAELKKQLALSENEIAKKESECVEIEKKLRNLDITVREQKKLQSRLLELQGDVRHYPDSYTTRSLKQKIVTLENTIAIISDEFSKIGKD